MTHKSGKVAERVAHLKYGDVDPRYAGFFECFNAGEYYESHDVLEDLWLECRGAEQHEFYKALIQLAGAFVHLQKDRLQAAGKLFRLCRSYLQRFPSRYEKLDVAAVLHVIDDWHQHLESTSYSENPLKSEPAPQISLFS
jgi:predicted metal-dependent hydrolase